VLARVIPESLLGEAAFDIGGAGVMWELRAPLQEVEAQPA
jgi:hypothetical protein